MPACKRCSESHSTPHAFLLTCRYCNETWHHRCHQPPVPDSELVARIKAYNEGDFENGMAGWVCRSCVKGKGRAVPQRSLPQAVFRQPLAQPQRPPPNSTNAPTDSALHRHHRINGAARHDAGQTTRPTERRSKSTSNKSSLLNIPPAPQIVDLTLSSDDEMIIIEPSVSIPVAPPQQAVSSPSKDQIMPPVEKVIHSEPHLGNIPPKTLDPPAKPDLATPPDLVDEPMPTKPEPELRPKLEPESHTRPSLTPWQKYNLAPSWIHNRMQDDEKLSPWETAPQRERIIPKRKLVAKHRDSIMTHDPFDFSAAAWMRAKTSTMVV